MVANADQLAVAATAVDGELLQPLGGIGLESGRVEDQVEPGAVIDDLQHRLPQREPTDRRVIDHLRSLLYPLDIVQRPPLRKLGTALLESLDESTKPGIADQMTRGISELGKQELGVPLSVHQPRPSVVGEDEPQQVAFLSRCCGKILSEAEDIRGCLVPGQQVELGIDQ